ncbi:hypothetical protein H6F77_09330 [Microcoleus sp. FACHB-831]|uniref:DUF6232 family protein n=1 Tax=Microcoleus sp. FACHB-831 TaxID=2692827 RepID=UPI001688E28A|nr:DUF6232 family protein [Microcoleus sp. FACHB-831]MBD1921292.1 hypothetical protein [Microcoleus sp. FACHB-831]
MAPNNILQNNTDPIKRNESIYITKKTVRFGSDVYQFRNVTGFGVAEFKPANIIPIKFILIIFVIGLIFGNIPDTRSWGITIVLFSLFGIILNTFQPNQYGLKLYLNSGGGPIFLTRDMEGLKKVVQNLYKFMDSDKEGSYIVNVQDSSIRIDGSVGGSVIKGDAENVSSHVGGDVSRKG